MLYSSENRLHNQCDRFLLLKKKTKSGYAVFRGLLQPTQTHIVHIHTQTNFRISC